MNGKETGIHEGSHPEANQKRHAVRAGQQQGLGAGERAVAKGDRSLDGLDKFA
jgi:hypothetical protein